jgi:hypothetical protein
MDYPPEFDIYLVMPDKFLILHIDGGIGKNVIASSLFRSLLDEYPDRKLIIVTSIPELFVSNPLIHKVYDITNTPYFYDSYIANSDTIVLKRNPLNENSHIMGTATLYDTSFEMYGLPTQKGVYKPEIYLNYSQKAVKFNWERPKPIFLMHTNGGPYGLNDLPYSWVRDIPPLYACEIAKLASNEFHVIQVCNKNSFKIPNVEVVNQTVSVTELIALVAMSKKRLLMNSCMQHIAYAFNLESTVMWVGMDPNTYGYTFHSNVISEPPTNPSKLISSYLNKYDISGIQNECPYNEQIDVFDMNKLLNSLDLKF